MKVNSTITFAGMFVLVITSLSSVSFMEYAAYGQAATNCQNSPVASVSAIGNDGNVPQNAIDGNLATRWSNLGTGSWIKLDLGAQSTICSVDIAWYSGNQRANNFVISTSLDGITFTNVYTGTSSGTTASFENYDFADVPARYVMITVNGNTQNNWASISEINIKSSSSSGSTDITKPTVSISNPANGATISNTSPTISGTSSDNVGVASVTVTVDGISKIVTGTTSWSSVTSGLLGGTHTIVATAKDAAGNIASATRSFSIDTIPPTVTASVPTGTYASTQSVTLAASEPATIYYTKDGSTPTTSSTVYSGAISISASTTLKFFAIDKAGNVGSVVTTIYTITSSVTSYASAILNDNPVMFLAMDTPSSGTQLDLTVNGHNAVYKGGTPVLVSLPNGDKAVDFNGATQYATIPSSPAFSIPTTGSMTWEAWIRPDVLNMPNVANSDGYVDWMGKCADYSPTCEWEARIYNQVNPQNRFDRLSGYVFNPSAGLGSAADWQPSTTSTIQAGHWYYVVVEYTTLSSPSGCSNTSTYPGGINIWVNGVLWSQTSHNPTGCMSQYSVIPKAGSSPLNIGTMALDSYFEGAIGKVAIYNHLLTQNQISAHYKAMTGLNPAGSCSSTCTLG